MRAPTSRRSPRRRNNCFPRRYATAKIFVEGLTRAGKDLSREKLITTLEGLYEYETGATPRITLDQTDEWGQQVRT